MLCAKSTSIIAVAKRAPRTSDATLVLCISLFLEFVHAYGSARVRLPRYAEARVCLRSSGHVSAFLCAVACLFCGLVLRLRRQRKTGRRVRISLQGRVPFCCRLPLRRLLLNLDDVSGSRSLFHALVPLLRVYVFTVWRVARASVTSRHSSSYGGLLSTGKSGPRAKGLRFLCLPWDNTSGFLASA